MAHRRGGHALSLGGPTHALLGQQQIEARLAETLGIRHFLWVDCDGLQGDDTDGHIDTIVQNFLEFSRPPKLVMQRISPSAVVDTVLQLLSHRLKSYDVHVEVIRSGSLPAVDADPDQLKEVLVNLVINACEAMERGGAIRIEEVVSLDTDGRREAVIRVSDNGPGIPEALRPKVFDPFFTTKEEGTGLGMSIAKRIIDEHHGWLDIAETEGGGATLIVTLPVKESTDESHPHHRR